MIEKDTRPVRYYICGKKMYYFGHPNFESEYTLIDEDNSRFKGYVHVSCIKFLKESLKK